MLLVRPGLRPTVTRGERGGAGVHGALHETGDAAASLKQALLALRSGFVENPEL